MVERNNHTSSERDSSIQSKKKIDELVREKEIRWVLFEKCIEELSLSEKDLEELEIAREEVWKETKKKYGL